MCSPALWARTAIGPSNSLFMALLELLNAPQASRTVWKSLEVHHRKVRALHLRDLFEQDSSRGERYTARAPGLLLDYSKNRITDTTISLLLQLAEASGLQARIDALFRGEPVNTTERRPALHIALRSPRGASIFVDGENVIPKVHSVLDRMSHFCRQVRSGEWKGCSGKRIRNVITVGVERLCRGPEMACRALQRYSNPDLTVRFIDMLDLEGFGEATRGIDPAETLCVICSRVFTSPEQMANAIAARQWIVEALGTERLVRDKHLVAIASDASSVAEFGVAPANTFEFWEWIGDRYSLCCAVGLPLMLAIGPEHFRSMLEGFHQLDGHFLATPFRQNLPVIMGLLSIWYNNLFGFPSVAVLPYEHYLDRFPGYVQNLITESNGKHITLIGTTVTRDTAPVCWTHPGANGRHSFHQLLHQGTRIVPCDFIVFAQPQQVTAHQDHLLVATAFAEARTLAFGKTADQVQAEGTADWMIPHFVLEGNRPSNTILASSLSPESLGKLIALYEHYTYTQAVIWNINAFDQWGVELGNEMARSLLPELESPEQLPLQHDSSTNSLIRQYRMLKHAS